MKLSETETVSLQFREATKKVSLHFALFRFVSLKKRFVTEVLLKKKFRFGSFPIQKFRFENVVTSAKTGI